MLCMRVTEKGKTVVAKTDDCFIECAENLESWRFVALVQGDCIAQRHYQESVI